MTHLTHEVHRMPHATVRIARTLGQVRSDGMTSVIVDWSGGSGDRGRRRGCPDTYYGETGRR
jgi:hypothetical protein